MASSFSVFRKNRKLMLALLTILAMFAFVFLPFVMEGFRSRATKNPDVITSKYGSLRESDLQMLRNQHQRVVGILTEVLQLSFSNQQNQQLAQQYQQYARQIVESFLGSATENELVNTWLLSRYADQMGMVISNPSINAFLKELTQNRVPASEFQAAFRRAGVPENVFFNAMRDQLLAVELRKIFLHSLVAVTPAERWNYFNRVKEQAVIEAVAVPVAQYLDRVQDPSPAELAAFFQENKERHAIPNSALPGFREPQRIELQYVKADYEKWLADVTDEEVNAIYERDKAVYEQREKAAAAGKSGQGQPESTNTITPPEGTKTPEESKAPGEPETSNDAKGSQDQEKAPPEDATRPEEKGEKKEGESNSLKEPGTGEDNKTEEKKDSDGVSAAQHRSAFQLVAFLEDAAEGPKEATVPEEAAKTTEREATSAAPETTASPEATEATKPAVESTAAPKEEPKPIETSTGPSERVKKKVREQIVGERLKKALDSLRAQLDRYRNARSKYDAAIAKGKTASKPAELDLEALAKEVGMTAGTTGWISQIEAQRTGIGNSDVQTGQPLWAFAFGSLSMNRPESSIDQKGNCYLFWKTDEKKERVPEYNDPGVHDAVLKAWKMIQARKFAAEEAKKLAEEARNSKASLKQTFADHPDLPVVNPEPFSWLTFPEVPLGSAPSAARLSDVSGVDMAGHEFMETVFGLKPDEVGVAMNAPKTVAYVICLTDFKPSLDVLWSQFKVDDFSKYAAAAQDDQRAIYAAWLEEIKIRADFKWAPGRAPDRTPEGQPRNQPRGGEPIDEE